MRYFIYLYADIYYMHIKLYTFVKNDRLYVKFPYAIENVMKISNRLRNFDTVTFFITFNSATVTILLSKL